MQTQETKTAKAPSTPRRYKSLFARSAKKSLFSWRTWRLGGYKMYRAKGLKMCFFY